jgi:hypothetical protein
MTISCAEATDIYWVLANNSSVHSVTVTQFCDTLVLTTSSSSSSSATSSPFFFLPWERVSSTFLGLYYASFLTRPLGLLRLFSTLPWASFGTSHEVQPPTWPSQEPSDLSGLNQNSLLWLAVKSLLRVYLGQWGISFLCIYCIFYIPTQFSFPFFVHSNPSLQMIGLVQQHSINSQSISTYCSVFWS